jgi:hypothetical protein
MASVLAVGIAGGASAAILEWHGTLQTKLGAGKLKNEDGSRRGTTGSGVATINGSGGGGLLHTMQIPGGGTGSDFNPVTDPDTVATIRSIGVTATTLGGTIRDLQASTQATGNMVIRGRSRLCIIVANCANTFDTPLTLNNANTGIGVGGILTGGKFGPLRISIVAGPWTVGSGSAINQTQKGLFKTVTATGFLHGAASSLGSTGQQSGVVQLISPMQVITSGAGANNELQSLFSIWTFHFLPEPGFLLLLGSGVVGLGILGRNRMRR